MSIGKNDVSVQVIDSIRPLAAVVSGRVVVAHDIGPARKRRAERRAGTAVRDAAADFAGRAPDHLGVVGADFARGAGVGRIIVVGLFVRPQIRRGGLCGAPRCRGVQVLAGSAAVAPYALAGIRLGDAGQRRAPAQHRQRRMRGGSNGVAGAVVDMQVAAPRGRRGRGFAIHAVEEQTVAERGLRGG